MIAVRSPLRVSLGGGGTDLPSYYREHEGFLLAAAIDKYVYINVMRPFEKGIYLKYSNLESVNGPEQIKHPIFREAIKLIGDDDFQLEITALADIPSGTGLGSSGSFTTALIKALYSHRRWHLNQEKLAELACYIEIEKLKEPIGKQDQYISAIGGITCFAFHKDDSVTSAPLNIDIKTLNKLEDNLLLFFTGFSRSASSILKDQDTRSQKYDSNMIQNLDYVKDLGYKSKEALELGDVNYFGELMHEHWENKKQRSQGMSNTEIDHWYDLALQNGAIGGKLVGAGGGGFLMFMANDSDKLRNKMLELGLEEVRFRFDFEGTKVILSS